MRIIYVIGKFLTFPGTFLRGFWEHITCLLLGIPVENTGYLRANEMCGHVEHALTRKTAATLLSATAPGFMMLLTGVPMALTGLANLRYMGATPDDSLILFAVYVLLTYVGISSLCCLHPHYEVAMNFKETVFEKFKKKSVKSVIGGLFMLLPAVLCYIGAVLERFSVPVVLWIAATAAIFMV